MRNTWWQRVGIGVASALLSAVLAGPASASGLDALTRFLSATQSGDVAFTQTITPAGQSASAQQLSGRMRFDRPNHFRFDYLKPYEQVIVADGQAVWLYDVDLMQVTVSDQHSTLATSPAGLLLAARDVGALQARFALRNLPDAHGLQWLSATPKAQDAAMVEARLGFGPAGLARLEMTDTFGQLSAFVFDGAGMGAAVGQEVFRFSPPPGADVIDQRGAP